MSENHREPEVTEEIVPVVECLDELARIISKELAPIHSVTSDTLQNACSTRPRVVVVRLMNSRQKRTKKNDDKSAVVMLKKCEWQEREPVTDESRSTGATWEEES